MRKKVDERIRSVIENGVKTSHRSMFLITGNNSGDQAIMLWHMLNKSLLKSRPSILWCYRYANSIQLSKFLRPKKQKRKRTQQMLIPLEDPLGLDHFTLSRMTFRLHECLERTPPRKTFDMCILEDIEALTPNLVTRVIEMMEGGGLIVLLLPSLPSLPSLSSMITDVQQIFHTESHSETRRLDERFLLSLASCTSCLVMDDKLNILSTSSHMESITPVEEVQELELGLSEEERKHIETLNAIMEELWTMRLGQSCANSG